ncbi:MAG TPA: FAD-dependent oxidoreductase [Casimicrobiaceae bacterium]|jgi:D-amino-acid dehydrogenase
MAQRVAVIGAGVVGLACATALQAEDHAVTLIDPRPPGEHCSYGNAGCLSRASCVPLGLPGTWKNVPGWLMDPLGPLSIAPGYLPRIAPWLWRFQRASAMPKVNRVADALHALLDPSIDAWRPLAARAGVSDLIVQNGYAFAYERESDYAADALGREIRRAHGVKMDVHTGAGIREVEPALSPAVTHLVVLPEQGHCPNPLRLSRALADRLRAGGAQFVHATATGFETREGRVARIRCDSESVDTDTVVVAAGAHSNALSSQLGADVPLETERGYHATLAAPTVVPRIPVMAGLGRWFATPMEDGLRVAGTVELAGLDAPPNDARADALVTGARRLFPGLDYAGVERWMGHRPSLPDSMPVIGRSPRYANALFAFGHGHVGLTAAAPTAGIVADLVAGRSPRIDIAAFSPARFS